MSSFIGKGDDVLVLRSLLGSGARLVTLTGAAGVGKTRLAREAATALATERRVVVCDVANARTAEDVASAVSRALRVPASSIDPLGRLAERVAERGSILLVLDNFDDLLPVADAALRPILAHAQRAQMLITSRERLGITDEWVHPVTPLSKTDGVLLLVDRVSRARRRDVDESERGTMARLVDALDGLPLALELVAPRVAAHGAINVLEHLERRHDQTSKSAHSGARTLRQAVDWAWHMLDTTEKAMLARCSAFRSGFTLEAALSITAKDPTAFEAMMALSDKALLKVYERLLIEQHVENDNIDQTRVRFTLHPAVLKYAATQASFEPDDEVYRLHAAHYLDLGIAWARDITSMHSSNAFQQLVAEWDNIVVACERALAARDGATAARALVALWPVVSVHGPIGPYVALACSTLALPLPGELRVALLATRSRARRRLGDRARADDDLQEAVVLAGRAGFRRDEARLLVDLGTTAYERCDYPVALNRFRAALAIQIALGDAAEQAVTLTSVSMVHRDRGALDDARDAAMRALSVHRGIGNALQEASSLLILALCDLELGELPTARTRLTTALSLVEGTENRELHAQARAYLGFVEHASGNLDAAEGDYTTALRAVREIEGSRHEGMVLLHLGIVMFDRGEWFVAKARLEQAQSALTLLGDKRQLALAYAYLAACCRYLEQEREIDGLIDNALALLEMNDPIRAAVEVIEATARGMEPAPNTTQHGARSWHTRLALRRHELAQPERRSSSFQVAADGAWMELEGGRTVPCDKRVATQRLLAALAKARTESPGRAIHSDELVAAGWPNERILSAAGKNRLRVALSWLRKNGLGHALTSAREGYFLDPELVGVAGLTISPSEIPPAARSTPAIPPPPPSSQHLV